MEYHNRAIFFWTANRIRHTNNQNTLKMVPNKNDCVCSNECFFHHSFNEREKNNQHTTLMFLLVNNNQWTRVDPWMQCNFIGLGHKHFYNQPSALFQCRLRYRYFICGCYCCYKYSVCEMAKSNIKIAALMAKNLL